MSDKSTRKVTGVPAPQWWKHLREYKGLFWRRARREAARSAFQEANENAAKDLAALNRVAAKHRAGGEDE